MGLNFKELALQERTCWFWNKTNYSVMLPRGTEVLGDTSDCLLEFCDRDGWRHYLDYTLIDLHLDDMEGHGRYFSL